MPPGTLDPPGMRVVMKKSDPGLGYTTSASPPS